MRRPASQLMTQAKSGDQTGPAWMLQLGLASVTSSRLRSVVTGAEEVDHRLAASRSRELRR